MKSNREILAELDAAEEQAMIAYIEGRAGTDTQTDTQRDSGGIWTDWTHSP